jgi:hypothetical protein
MARKLLLFGAAVVAAGIFLKRDKVAGLLPSRAGEPYSPPSPGPSNYDAPGPVANTATPVPAPEPQQPPAVDEAAEEAAAAAEAANIGGQVSDYAGPAGEVADEEQRPLAEAGEGESEGLEQAEFELEQAAQPTAPGMSDEERQIEEAIEAAENPAVGETVEPVQPVDEPGDESTRPSASDLAQPDTTGWAPPVPQTPAEATASPAGPEPTREPDEPDEPAEPPPSPAAAEPPTEVQDTGVGHGGQVPKPDDPAPLGDKPEDKQDEGEGGEGTDWRTWSGRSINP